MPWGNSATKPVTFEEALVRAVDNISPGGGAAGPAATQLPPGLTARSNLSIEQARPNSGTTTTVASVTTGTAGNGLGSNPNRFGASFYNNSTSVLSALLGTGVASSTLFTVRIAPIVNGIGGYYELPYGYTGPVSLAWDTVNGDARVTEYT